jgi:hypothetical protein
MSNADVMLIIVAALIGPAIGRLLWLLWCVHRQERSIQRQHIEYKKNKEIWEKICSEKQNKAKKKETNNG